MCQRSKGLAFLSLDASFHKMQAILGGGRSRFGGGGEGMSGEIKAGPRAPLELSKQCWLKPPLSDIISFRIQKRGNQ